MKLHHPHKSLEAQDSYVKCVRNLKVGDFVLLVYNKTLIDPIKIVAISHDHIYYDNYNLDLKIPYILVGSNKNNNSFLLPHDYGNWFAGLMIKNYLNSEAGKRDGFKYFAFLGRETIITSVTKKNFNVG